MPRRKVDKRVCGIGERALLARTAAVLDLLTASELVLLLLRNTDDFPAAVLATL
jgi:hypothetical protein